MRIGFQEILFITFIILLLFGGKKIPELMKGLGKGISSFKQGMKEVETDINDAVKDKENEGK
ncbi:MAG: twin-arginine translocase TatA/TatE family subunit [Paludibacter sp.]|nr:twin-arginine translocase TatA/TatE family subunit [Paludibacter sp.]